MTQDVLEKAFLAELEALEKFRISYTGMYPGAPLGREDPDVRRLIEAMAMFTARTRVAAQRNIGESMLRLFRQHFPYLLSPVPAMTMLRAAPTSRYVDVTEIPRGTEVMLVHRAPGGGGNGASAGSAPEPTFRFQTLAKLRLLPIEIDGVDIFRVRSRGYRILLRFSTAFARSDEIGELNLYVNHLNELLSSVTVLYEIKTHLRAVSCVFGAPVKEDTVGQPCEVYFGAPKGSPHEVDAFEHPLQQSRAFLHFPQQELFINVKGIRPPRNWQTFTLVFDVDDTWPSELRLTADGFQLHVVPIANVKKDTADPIECDGTKERYLARHPDTTARFVPHSVLGVFRVTGEGLVPLEPGVVGIGRESYEAQVEGVDEERRAWITLNLPGAFDKPERVVVEAFWHQPRLRDIESPDYRVRLADRFVDGVEWSAFGPVVPHTESALEDDRDGLLQLLSIKNQRFLNVDELAFLARALGAHKERHFSKLVSAVSAVKVTNKPFARRSNGFKYVYEITFNDLDGSDMPQLDLYCRRLLDILATWSMEEVVELVARVPNLDKSLEYS